MRDDASEATPATPASPDPTGDPAAEDAARAAELSRAAREAVRSSADPRIDRQLARMGLAPETEDGSRPAARAVRQEEIEALREEAAAARAALGATRQRLSLVTWLAVIEAIAVVALVVVLLVR